MDLTAVSILEGKRILGIRWPATKICAALVVLLASSLASAQFFPIFVDRNSKCNFIPSPGQPSPVVGTKSCPYPTVTSAVRFNHKDRDLPPAPSGATLIIRAGTYPEAILLNKPMVIKAEGGTVTLGPEGPTAPFDLVTRALDVNRLPLNPDWHSGLRDPRACPRGRDKDKPDPGVPPCTNQATYFNKGVGCGMHVQWFPATYTGVACWDHYEGPIISGDNDFNINLVTDNGAGFTQVSPTFLHGEMRGDETIDNIKIPWWAEFRKVAERSDDIRARGMIDGSRAIMTGLVSMDCHHICETEIHPIWALAMNVQPSVDDDVWELFLNNAGFGGSCIGDIDQEFMDFPNKQYTFRLPWKPGAIDVKHDENIQKFNVSRDFFSVSSIRDQAVFVTFTLDPPRKDGPMWAAELHLHWVGPNVSPGGRAENVCRAAFP